ncbi:uncharacterized protein BX663DRAFT_551855 [Cokeromyces recurvatus]|uniref:uncharacterized protein n=1 Tax=Cokeromyces recurvatus TaxID=90255 RepID=UPI0022207999|nr:uncharacterized protein BX663DRAFT_551855 [Cokeromyces recurvatus]KAI7902998.1 hypothetical protein BX663DRAFT_551855 [Cokeromyces recurvatus]
MNITRNQAICIYFYVDYTDENVNLYNKKIEGFDDVEIYWNMNEKEPVIVSKKRVRGDPMTYRKYLEAILSLDEDNNKRERIELVSESQVKQFINEVYCYEKPYNEYIYLKQTISTKTIYETVQNYTIVFEQKTTQAFATWCRNSKLRFLHAKEKRGNRRTRELYVLEDIYHDDLVKPICSYLQRYQDSLKHLIEQGYEIVGYARKSPTDTDIDNRARLLQLMVANLRERSFATKVYVSPCSWGSSPFIKCDFKNNDNKMMKKSSDVNGNTQDLLHHLQSSDHNICLVSIDFSCLTSRSQDIRELIEMSSSVKKIAIETFTQCNEMGIFNTKLLITDNSLLQTFNN